MAEICGGDVETPKPIEGLGRLLPIRLVVDVVRCNGASTALGAGVAALTGNELCLAVGAPYQEGLVAGVCPGVAKICTPGAISSSPSMTRCRAGSMCAHSATVQCGRCAATSSADWT